MLPRVRVGFSPVWGALLLAIAALDVFVYALGHDTLQLGLAGVMALLGVAHLFGTILVAEGHRIELKNPVGMTLRVLEFGSPKDLEVVGRKLWVTTTTGERRKVSGFNANRAHWRELVRAIEQAKAPA